MMTTTHTKKRIVLIAVDQAQDGQPGAKETNMGQNPRIAK